MQGVCSHCGHDAGAGDRHCRTCGRLLGGASVLPARTPLEPPGPLCCRFCAHELKTLDAFEVRLRFFSGVREEPHEEEARRRAPDPWEVRLVLDMRGEAEPPRLDEAAARERNRRRARAMMALNAIPMERHTRIIKALVKPCPECGASDPLGVA